MEKNTIGIVAIWQTARTKTPGYALAAHWDMVTHYFTDYAALDRAAYELPESCTVSSAGGVPRLYDRADMSRPLQLVAHWRGGLCRPAVWLASGRLAVFHKPGEGRAAL